MLCTRRRKQPIDFPTIISLISLVKRAHNRTNNYACIFHDRRERKHNEEITRKTLRLVARVSWSSFSQELERTIAVSQMFSRATSLALARSSLPATIGSVKTMLDCLLLIVSNKKQEINCPTDFSKRN